MRRVMGVSVTPVPTVGLLQLRYTFAKYMLLQEPLLIIAAFYLLFLSVIIYVRLDFAISKVQFTVSYTVNCTRHTHTRECLLCWVAGNTV